MKRALFLATLFFVVGVGITWPVGRMIADRIQLTRDQDVAVVVDAVYLKECGVCHMAYQPGLLPKRSWARILTAEALRNHYGEPATFDETTRQHLMQIALSQAADTGTNSRSQKIVASLGASDAPLRISEVPYIHAKHKNISPQLIHSDKVRSLSLCDHCHEKALQGIYTDGSVHIPR